MFTLDELKEASQFYSIIYNGENFYNLPKSRQVEYVMALRQIKENNKQ